MFHSTSPAPVGPVRSGPRHRHRPAGPARRPLFVWGGANEGWRPGWPRRTWSASTSIPTPRRTSSGTTPGRPRQPVHRLDGRLRDKAVRRPSGAGPAAGAPGRSGRGAPLRARRRPGWRSTTAGPRPPSCGTWTGADGSASRTGRRTSTPTARSWPRPTSCLLVDAPRHRPVGAGSPMALTHGHVCGAHRAERRQRRRRHLEPTRGDRPVTLTDDDGEPLVLAPGRTWVGLPDSGVDPTGPGPGGRLAVLR